VNTWEWAFGDGGFDKTNTPTPTYVYPLNGTFNVTLKIKDSNGCDSSVTISKYVNVSAPPTIIISKTPNPVSSCLPPLNVTLSASGCQSNSPKGTALTYLWDFDNGTTSSQVSPATVTYPQKGNYTIILKVTDDNNCSAIDSVPVTINNAQASFQVPDTVCTKVTFHNKSIGTLISWDYGDGTTGTDSVHTYAIPGKAYNVKLTVSTSLGPLTCIDDTTITIFVQEVKAKFTSAPHYSCSSPMTVLYTDQSKNATQWLWVFGNAKTATVQHPTNVFIGSSKNPYTIYDPTYFTDKLYVTSKFGCVDSITIPRNDTLHLPTSRFMPDKQQGCVPLNVNFSDSSRSKEKIISREWIWGDGSKNTGNDSLISHTYTASGVYYPKLVIVNSKGCRDTSFVIPIEVGKKPHPSFSLLPTTACPGQAVTFTNLTPAADSVEIWHYETDGQIMSSCPGDANPTWKFTEKTGPQDIKLTVASKGCYADTTIVNAITIKGPIADFYAKSDCAQPYTYTFTAVNQDVSTWNLYFGDGKDSLNIPGNVSTIVHTYTASGNYNAILHGFNATSGCSPQIDTVVVHARKIKAAFLSDTIFCAREQQLCRCTCNLLPRISLVLRQ
jgi:PKD repeat protein